MGTCRVIRYAIRRRRRAGRGAGCGLVVGVLTGTSGPADLAPLADTLLDNIADLPERI